MLLKQNSIDAHRLWDSVGRPKSGEIWLKQLAAKQEYKRAIKRYQLDECTSISNELNDHLLSKDLNNFWKSWKSKFAKPKFHSNVIDGESDSLKICKKLPIHLKMHAPLTRIIGMSNYIMNFLKSIPHTCQVKPLVVMCINCQLKMLINA